MLLAAPVLLPDRLRLDQWTPFAQVVAFRPGLAAATVVLSLLLLARREAWPSAAVFGAFHAAEPVSDLMDQWRHDLGLLPRWCSLLGHAIVAGDLNATLDQSVLRDNASGCSDAADRRGQGVVGTWPSTWPRWLAVPIDHVLATVGIDTRDVDVLDNPGK